MYYKIFGYKIEVMGVSFCMISQIIEFVGCDLLMISFDLLQKLQESNDMVVCKLLFDMLQDKLVECVVIDEVLFCFQLNDEVMVIEKFVEGICVFVVDVVKFEKLIDVLC